MRLFNSNIKRYILAASLCLLCTACASASADQSSMLASQRLTDKEQGFDLNGDNEFDAWRYYVTEDGKKKLSSKFFDFNFDGKVDFKRFYNDKGKVLRDEMDMDFDGQFDNTTFYKDDIILRKEMNVAGDEKPEIYKHYEDGKITYLEGDRDADGILDYFEYYRDGKLVRLGYDRNGDGRPDHWEELDEN